MQPILNGPPGVILLMFIAAMAAYLRLVSSTARDKIENILAGKDVLWPPSDPDTVERLRILDRTRHTVMVVTHVFFALALLAATRLFFVVAYPDPLTSGLLWFIDFLLTAVIAASIAAMWVSHTWNRTKDDQLFQRMRPRAEILRQQSAARS
jgi:hypothetical protein